VVNVEDLNQFRAGTAITKEKLAEAGLIRKATKPVKILGNGELEKKFKFEGIEAFSASAKEKIEKAGGEIL
jgi:large subunit ribosomal protein L15